MSSFPSTSASCDHRPVVETGSITETARRLGRTQPAITLQMKRLEDLTGKALFKEDSRARCSPTMATWS